MGSRNSDRQFNDREGSLATDWSPKVYRPLLLPYEKQLAASIGLTEKEYLLFKKEVERKGRVRPAAYDHIPDIRNEPTTIILINLAIGLVLTGVSMLLAPKPKAPDEKEQRQIKQNDLTGPSRYNSTYGFDSVGEIATWATPIPIPFGKFVDKDGIYSGGIVVTPSLVWSRLFSYGSQQIAKLLYAGGEFGSAVPSANSIYVGTQPLSKLSEFNYAVYYRRTQGDNRLKGSDLILGTRGSADSGDPTQSDDVFTCPTADGEVDEGFCMAYTPSGDTAFGIYDCLANGTARRVNWKIVSYPESVGSGAQIKAERSKICGISDRDEGMPGVGREYGRQLGIFEYRSPGGGWQTVGERTLVAMDVDWEVKYLISGRKIEIQFRSDAEVNSSDIQNESANERAAADQSLQLGETIQIGRMTWVVRSRELPIWREEDEEDQVIILQATDRFGAPGITVCKKDDLKAKTLVNAFRPGESAEDNAKHIGLAATPLSKQARAVIRPTREADCLEVGIRSQVWQQFNGLCNFQEVPSPDSLEESDDDDVTITNGNMNVYSVRSSCFTVKVRPVGLDGNGDRYEWGALNNQFVVTGRRPVDVFNYLRFEFPQERSKYEFRFEALPGATVIDAFTATEIFEQLDSANGEQQRIPAVSPYGTFLVYYTGRRVAQATLLLNSELGGSAKGYVVAPGSDAVQQVEVENYRVDNGVDTGHGQAHGWRSEILGFPQQNQGQTKSVDIFKGLDDGRTIGIRVTANSIYSPGLQSAPWYEPQLYGGWIWDRPTFEVIASSGSWNVGDQFFKGYDITNDPVTKNNKFLAHAYRDGYRRIYANFRILQVGESDVGGGTLEGINRVWSGASQVSEVAYYPSEITHSNQSSPEHNIIYVNESVANNSTPTYYNMNMFGMSVRSTGRLVDVSQLRYWVPGGVEVDRTYPEAFIFDDQADAFGRSNLFTDLVWYLLTNKDTGAGDTISTAMLDRPSFVLSSKFLVQNRIFCDTVIQEPTNIREYASRIAPLMLCNFVMKAGEFAVVPAVPVTDSGEISLSSVPITQIFSEGNIIRESLTVEYLPEEDRAPFKASGTYREGEAQQLPEEKNIFVRYAGSASDSLEGTVPLEQFPMAEWCTQKEQAVLACKYMLALRKHVTHTVTFKTSPDGLGLAPGDYIKLVTQSNPFSGTRIGTISATGALTTIDQISDGTYEVEYYVPGSEGIKTGQLIIKNNVSITLKNVVFSWGQATNKSGVYMVEQLTIGEDMLVEIIATSFPVDENGVSIISKDITTGDDNSMWAVSE